MNGNALYWLQDDRFFQFLDRVWEKLPDAPHDIAIFSHLHDLANFRETKLALARIHFTDFIQNFGGTPYVVDKLMSEYPDTYLVHSSCRPEFPDHKLLRLRRRHAVERSVSNQTSKHYLFLGLIEESLSTARVTLSLFQQASVSDEKD